ncbi:MULTISPECIES: hypothetical protein [Pseudomonas]|uniref:hypothetical protein n=1 Tax=Pseudomonas TaxID=286 RepID=UPI001E647BF6|nr:MULTISPECIES: hypothetical protein [Pseudomonas]
MQESINEMINLLVRDAKLGYHRYDALEIYKLQFATKVARLLLLRAGLFTPTMN